MFNSPKRGKFARFFYFRCFAANGREFVGRVRIQMYSLFLYSNVLIVVSLLLQLFFMVFLSSFSHFTRMMKIRTFLIIDKKYLMHGNFADHENNS